MVALKEIITIAVSAAMVIIKFSVDLIKTKLTEKMQVSADEIAGVVEVIYNGASSAEKLAAFKSLAAKKGLNIKKAVKYLETRLIPNSKILNVYKLEKPENDKGVI